MTDHVLASERWVFDQSVAGVFDDMLARSIPGYGEMRDITTELALHYCAGQPAGIMDLGTSTGDALFPILAQRPHAFGYALELAPAMVDAARKQLAEFENVAVVKLDLRYDPLPECEGLDVVLSILTLQFVPVEHRYHILADAYARLRTGGALVLVEKVLASSPQTEAVVTALYYDRKRANGYSEEEITRKRLALEGVLVPNTKAANEHLLAAVGFRFDQVWQSLNFAGWLAIKP